MSQPTSFGPFPTPEAKPPEAAGAPFQFAYIRAYQYVFDNPNWLTTVLFWSLCVLAASAIPILPYLVLIGHMFEIIVSLLRTGGTRYPDFDSNRLGDYLSRGIWPTLVAIVVSIPFVILLMILYFAVGMGMMAAMSGGGGDAGAAIAIVSMILFMMVVVVSMIALGLLLTPMMLRAGLSEEFGAAFDFGWTIDFVKRTWLEMILASLFLQFSGMLLSILGLMAACIGIYPAAALNILAYGYMYYQLYALYLSRGGTPVAIKQPAVGPVATAPPPPGY